MQDYETRKADRDVVSPAGSDEKETTSIEDLKDEKDSERPQTGKDAVDIEDVEERSSVSDMEPSPSGDALQREVSGPPYSIFTPLMKRWIIFLVSVSAVISPFAATTYYPALNTMSEVLHVTPTLTNVSVTTYMIAQAIAPSIMATMSDTGGRRFSFIVCFVIFIVGSVGLALQTNYAALLVLRMVQALGSSASIALSIAVVADIATSAERGKAMGYATAGTLFGPAFGPTIGGVLAHYLGWRSIFWFLAIYAGVILIIFAFFFPETCRNVVGNGSIPARGINRSLYSYLQARRRAKHAQSSPDTASQHSTAPPKQKFKFPNPLLTLKVLREKESCVILLYNGLFFTGMMVITTSTPNLFEAAYGLDELRIGLCFIANGAGALISALTMGRVTDWNFSRHAKRLNIPITLGKQQDLSNFPLEVARLQIAVPGHIIGTLGMLLYGWTLKFQTHLAGPEVALFLVGFGVSTAFNVTNTLFIDLHRDNPATATAAVNLARCLMSAGGVAAIKPMCDAMNPGWAYTLIGLLYAVLIVVVFWLMRCGMGWRVESEKRKREILESEKGEV